MQNQHNRNKRRKSSRTSRPVVNYCESESEDDELMYNDRKPTAMPTKPRKADDLYTPHYGAASAMVDEDEQPSTNKRRVTLSPGNEGDDEVRTVLVSSSFFQNYSKILSFLFPHQVTAAAAIATRHS
jgi:hypothetical protein